MIAQACSYQLSLFYNPTPYLEPFTILDVFTIYLS